MSIHNYAARSYASAAVETQVASASPHGLIVLLFDGLFRQLRMARTHMQQGDGAARARCIGKATDILVQGLALSVSEESGGELGQNLSALYDYCGRQLALANARNDLSLVDEVLRLLEPLREAWCAIDPTKAAAR